MKSFTRQAECFKYADSNGMSVFFKAYQGEWGRFHCCKSIRDLSKSIHFGGYLSTGSSPRTSQELLRDGKWLYPYWDLDAKFTTKFSDDLRMKVVSAFEKLCEKVFPFIGCVFERSFLEWSDSSGEVKDGYKLSLHAVYTNPNMGFEYNRANKPGRDPRKSMNEFGKLCMQESEHFEDLWFNKLEDGNIKRKCMIDPNVWTSNRCMRCVGCHKAGETRFLLPLNVATNQIDRDFTRSDIEKSLISRTAEPKTPCIITVDLVAPTKTVIYSKTILEQIANKLGCQLDRIEPNFVTLKTNADGRTCPLTNEHYRPGNNRCYLSMTGGEIRYKQFGVVGSLLMGKCEQPKTYEYFNDISKLQALHNQLGTNFTRKHIQTYLRETIIYLQNPFHPQYIVKVDDFKHGYGYPGIIKQFKYQCGLVKEGLFGKKVCPTFRCHEPPKTLGEEPEVKKVKISTVLEQMLGSNQLITYDRKTFVPYCIDQPYLGNSVFNTFIPFSLLNYTPKKVAPPFTEHAMYKLMKKDLTGGDPVGLGYLLDYIAHKLQKPSTRIETALCFIRTTQGVGKGQMAKWLTLLFDEKNCKTVANLDHLFGRFNAHLQTSLWCFLEEIKAKGSAWEHSGRLKDLITSRTQLWEKKYCETEDGSWYGQIVIFSNDSYGIRIENCDRRYCVFDTNHFYRDNKALHDLVDKQTMDPDYMAIAFKFFMERDVSKWNWRDIPETETRMAVKECCENVFMSFTRWLFESRENFLFDSWNYDKLRVNLLGKGDNLVAETYNTHLIEAFRTYKHRSGHPTKMNYKRQILDGIEQLWGPCFRRSRRAKRKCQINVKSLQAELTRHFRGPVILEIIKVNVIYCFIK